MVPVTDLLFETPPLDDPGSSTIERDIMRRCPCANGWLVDRCPRARDLPSSSLICAPFLRATTLWSSLRSTILSQVCDRPWRHLGSERRGHAHRRP